jgi:predicted amidophosphoribosyltransferase
MVFCMECGGGLPCPSHAGGAICRAAADYGEVTRTLVHAMKYANGREIAVIMGELMAGMVARPDVDFLVPIPLHRRSERDYNQTELMAVGASRVWGVPVMAVLSWSGRVKRQALQPGRADRSLPRGAMRASRELSPGTRVLLIDDVYTTGNTLNVAAWAIRRAGADPGGAMVWSRSGR